jgi:hypothetical protein
MRRDTSSNQQKYIELSQLLQAAEEKTTVKNTNTWFTFSIVILLILIIVSLSLKYWKRLRGTSCTRMIPWRNGEQASPGPAVRTPPQPRARERFPLSRIPEETDREIAEEVHPLNNVLRCCSTASRSRTLNNFREPTSRPEGDKAHRRKQRPKVLTARIISTFDS